MIREVLSESFYRDEFACKGSDCCGNSAPIDHRLVTGLDDLKKVLLSWADYSARVEILITSGFRCATHNKLEGGAEDSYHLKAMAADIKCFLTHQDGTKSQIPQHVVFEAALQIAIFKGGGIGIYTNRVHLDVGPCRRWVG